MSTSTSIRYLLDMQQRANIIPGLQVQRLICPGKPDRGKRVEDADEGNAWQSMCYTRKENTEQVAWEGKVRKVRNVAGDRVGSSENK